VAVDDADEGERHRRGGWWGRSRATCGCDGGRREAAAAAAVGGAMPKRKWCVVCVTYRTLLGEASENCEVATK
jgi:hypothetical protein